MSDLNLDLNLDLDEECLDVSVRPDGVDGSGNYKFVCKIEHFGHQSYGQSFGIYFSTNISVVEVPGDVEASAEGNHLLLKRNNQLNNNGLVEVWIKLSAEEQPQVTGITDITCQPEEGGEAIPMIGAVQRAVFARRSTRNFQSYMLPKDVIKKIIKAGTYAPTGMNRQSPVILAVTNKEMRDKLSAMNAEILGNQDTDPFYGAPVVLIVLADKDIPTYLYDGTLVMGNMMLAAEELGIGSCWIHRAKEEFESEQGKEILKSLGITGNYEGIGHLVLGYANEEKRAAAPRKDHYAYFIE